MKRSRASEIGKALNRLRNRKLTSERRSEIGKLAAKARWANRNSDVSRTDDSEDDSKS